MTGTSIPRLTNAAPALQSAHWPAKDCVLMKVGWQVRPRMLDAVKDDRIRPSSSAAPSVANSPSRFDTLGTGWNVNRICVH